MKTIKIFLLLLVPLFISSCSENENPTSAGNETDNDIHEFRIVVHSTNGTDTLKAERLTYLNDTLTVIETGNQYKISEVSSFELIVP